MEPANNAFQAIFRAEPLPAAVEPAIAEEAGAGVNAPAVAAAEAAPPAANANPFGVVKSGLEYIIERRLGTYDARIQEKIPQFFRLLKENDALLAGGSVLAAYEIGKAREVLVGLNARRDISDDERRRLEDNAEYESQIIADNLNDLDIYVPIKNVVGFYTAMFGEGNRPGTPNELGLFGVENRGGRKNYGKFNSGIYCESFLRRNGIKTVHRYSFGAFSIDVMAVRKKRTPLDVVNNFDLTFCQIWFDGETTSATFPDHVIEKKGYVQKDYLPLLYRGNRFLKRRIRKYSIDRGFTIFPNPTVTADDSQAIFAKTLEDITRNLANCKSPTGKTPRYQNEEFLHRWSVRMILNFIATYNWPFLPRDHEYQQRFLRTYAQEFKTTMLNAHSVKNIKLTRAHTYDLAPYIGLSPADGYDSEDADTPGLEKLKAVAAERAVVAFPQDQNIATAADLASDFSYYRFANRLLRYLYKQIGGEDSYETNITRYLGDTLTDIKLEEDEYIPNATRALKAYFTTLRELCLRTIPEGGADGYYFADEGDQVYDLHNHPPQAGITAETLEGYLTGYLREPEHSAVPCYYRNPGDPAHTCTMPITYDDIRYIVSPAFYKKYVKPAPIKTGLDQTITALNVTMPNTKSDDPLGFGEIYHYTMCPFCLQLERREEGCAYMTHDNPKGLPGSEAPFCKPEFVVSDIREKYRVAALQYLEDEGLEGLPTHLEFCIECGRPCINHNHFDLNDPPGVIPSTNPGICDGGGRAELFARILAVREVYRDSGIDDPKTERATAALAADAAMSNDDLRARGQVIADMPPDDRIWGNANIPAAKNYNDPAYRARRNNEESNAGSNAGSNAEEEGKVDPWDNVEALVGLPGGGARPKRHFRLTKKHGKQRQRKRKHTKKH